MTDPTTPPPASRAAAEESVPRYRLEQSISNGKPLAEFKLDDDGSWMHATEALPVITALRAQLDTAHAELRMMASSFADEVVLADEVVSLRTRLAAAEQERDDAEKACDEMTARAVELTAQLAAATPQARETVRQETVEACAKELEHYQSRSDMPRVWHEAVNWCVKNIRALATDSLSPPTPGGVG